MRRIVGVSFLTIALMTFCSSAAIAQVALDAVGVLDQYCADDEPVAHPERIVMRQLMTSDRLATFGGTVFAGIYSPRRTPDRTGTMSVRARIERPDGSREKLNRIVAHQQPNGEAEVQARFPVAAQEGDTVVWRYRFRDFAEMQPGDCFLLIGATMRP
ncbi:MAG: hypothetical protein GY769_20750 [bacterium]|nr:hypothetical protein [bacterium]